MTSASRIRAIGAAMLLAVFAAGAAAGVAVERWMHPRPTIKVLTSGMSPVLDKLELTRAQRARAESILERSAPLAETVMREMGERLRLMSDSLDAELRTILTPVQRARLDSLRPQRKLLLKRNVGPGGASVTDTVFPRRDTTRPQ